MKKNTFNNHFQIANQEKHEFYKDVDMIILNIYLYKSEIWIIWKYFMIETTLVRSDSRIVKLYYDPIK